MDLPDRSRTGRPGIGLWDVVKEDMDMVGMEDKNK